MNKWNRLGLAVFLVVISMMIWMNIPASLLSFIFLLLIMASGLLLTASFGKE
jgi:hypothetical protein